MKFCGNCGSQQPDDAVTCENCGSPLSSPVSQQPQVPPQQVQQPYVQQPQQQIPQQQVTQHQIYVQGQMPVGKIPSNPSDKKKAIAALVLGIIGLVLGWTGALSILGLIISIIGVYLAVKARNAIPANGDGRGLATGGLVCGIIGIVLGGIVAACTLCAVGTVGCTSCAGASASSSSYWNDILNDMYYVAKGTFLPF